MRPKLPVVATLAALIVFASCSRLIGATLPMKLVADVPLSGNATRLDYASLDAGSGKLYLAHMGDGTVIVFNTRTRKIEATVEGVATVRGVLAVPQLHRVYASAQGTREVVVIDMGSNRIVARVAAGEVDGLAYDPITKRVFASDEAGRRDVVIDAMHNTVVGVVPLGGEAGNTVYDARSHHMLVAVQTSNELVEIDPLAMRVIGRYPLAGSNHSHGIALDERTHVAYVAGELNASVVAFDLHSKKVVAQDGVGSGVDVLAVDPGLGRLYVASESGIVSVFDVSTSSLKKIGQSELAFNAHVVAVDPGMHLIYFPLRDVGGKPTLRIMQPSEK